MALDEPKEDDVVEIINGIQVAIEKSILHQAHAMTLDYQQTPNGSGLITAGGGDDDCC